jgi:hypothetical protein
MLLGAARRISNVQQHDDREEPPSTRPDRPDQRPLEAPERLRHPAL